MNRYEVGMLAISKAGHDFNHLYVIIAEDEEYVYLVDGKTRTIDRPKKKRKKHIQVIKQIQKNIADKCKTGGKIENEEIKRTLKIYNMLKKVRR